MSKVRKAMSIAALCFLLGMRSSINADGIETDSPSVQITWKPAIELGIINASITNKNSYVIKVDPMITVRYGRSLSDMHVWAEDKDVFKPVIFFAPVPPQGQPQREGIYPFPVSIEPDATKDMKFIIQPDEIAGAKGADSAKLFLQLDKAIFSQITLKNIHDALNVKQSKSK